MAQAGGGDHRRRVDQRGIARPLVRRFAWWDGPNARLRDALPDFWALSAAEVLRKYRAA